jgi:hypothetical protein
LVEIVHTIRYALDNDPESYPVYEADILKCLEQIAPQTTTVGRA